VFKWINNGKEEVGEKEKNWVGLGWVALLSIEAAAATKMKR
jgi:hypothetical protein